MNSTRLLDFKRFGYLAAVFAILLSTTLPSLAFAAQVTERSIALSSSTASATGTTYNVSFKAVAAAGAFVVDFCTSPAIGAICTAPTDMDATAADSGDFTDVTGSAHKVIVEEAITAGSTVTGAITGVKNPSTSGVFYARIVTFADTTDAAAYNSATVNANNPGTVAKDQGGVAMSITPTFSVTGAVLETLVFCASGAAIDPSCTGTLTSPNVSLGTSGVLTNTLSEGKVYSQISTNAVKGAVVNLKSNTTGCGGLVRAGAANNTVGCGIGPQTIAGVIATDAAKFGVRFADLDDGTGQLDLLSSYSETNHFMNYVAGDGSGVTSTYGDPIYSTHDEPISNGEANLVFGADIGNDTPAGTYSANLSLIATGKF